MIAQRFRDVPKSVLVARTEEAAFNQLNDFRQLLSPFNEGAWMIAPIAQGSNLWSPQAKQVEVLFAHFLADLDISAVQGTDRESTVHRELHVPSSRCFLARQRDLH